MVISCNSLACKTGGLRAGLHSHLYFIRDLLYKQTQSIHCIITVNTLKMIQPAMEALMNKKKEENRKENQELAAVILWQEMVVVKQSWLRLYSLLTRKC